MEHLKDKTIGYWAKRIIEGIKDIVEERIDEYNLKFPEAIIMIILFHKGPSSLVEIARVVEHAHPSVLRVVDTLEEKNLLIRTQHPEDRRVKIVSLTNEGEVIAEKVFLEFENANNLALNGISDTEFLRTIETMQKICKNLNASDPIEDMALLGKKGEK